MTFLDTSRAAGYAAQADRSALRALGYVEQGLDALRRTTDVRQQTEALLRQLHISFRWVDSRLDLMGPDGNWVEGPDLKGAPGTEVGAVADVPGLVEALAGKQAVAAALAALAQVEPAPDRLAYFAGANVGALAVLTAFARTVLAAADAPAARGLLELAAVAASGSYLDLSNRPSLGTAAAKDVGTAAGQVPLLDSAGKLASGMMPAIAITDIFVVASQAAMLALTAERGDVAIRSDLNKSFILASDSPATLADWKELLTPTDLVLSVAGLTGAISAAALKTALGLVAADIGVATAAELWTGTANGKIVTPAVFLAAQAFQALVNATTVAPDLNAGINFKWTRTANSTLGQPSNLKEGWAGTIRLDGTGTLSFNTCWDITGGTPTASAAAGTYDYLDYQVVNAAGGAKSIRANFRKAT